MFIDRDLESHVRSLMQWFPVVSVTGPRQSGKSTLLGHMLPGATYLNLEEPGLRELASEDPVGFLAAQEEQIIIDEAQNVPELFSAVQLYVDEHDKPGQVVLSGSQNFLLMERISQSLAGRVGIAHLLPLGWKELQPQAPGLEEFAIRGGYPRIYETGMPPEVYFDNYISTYLERDVGGLLNVRNLQDFRRFLALCALNAGALVNYSAMANELDVSFNTVKSWMGILESSFITLPLPPFHASARKRVTKTPKLYFWDTGLLCHLLKLATPSQLALSKHRGAVFENLLVAEMAKRHLSAGTTPELYFYRDDSRREIDLLDFSGAEPRAYEVKASQTFNAKYGRHLVTLGDAFHIPPTHRTVVYGGKHEQTLAEFSVKNFASVLSA